MRVDSGAAPLSLALLKALGAQQPAPAAATATPAAKPPAGKALAVAPDAASPDAATAGARALPRGSFVDIRA